MKYRPNKLKKILNEGKVAFGTCMCAYSPNLVELAGYCGFDFCRIDNEHAWRQDSIMEHMMRASLIGDIVPIARVDKDDPYLIRKVLEIGAMGVLIPNIKNSKEVEKIVEAAKFPPQGCRGFSGLCFSGKYGKASAKEWIEWSNEECMVGAMIETPEAVQNVDAIMSVEGLDFVLFGAADYSISIGLDAPDKGNPKVRDAIKMTIEAANENGKYVMIGIAPPWDKEAQKYIQMGCRMIELGHDYSVLGREWEKGLKTAKKAI